MRIIKLAFALILLIFGISFSILNAEQVTFNYYLGSTDMPLSLILFSSFIGGIFVGLIGGLTLWLNQQKKTSQAKKAYRETKKELDKLRVSPLQDSVQ